jgi:hypothetical protein
LLVRVFPLPILGVLLLFEAIALMLLVRDQVPSPTDFGVALFVAALAAAMPYGYVIALLAGTVFWHGQARLRRGA